MNGLASIAREWIAAERAGLHQRTHEEIARAWIATERMLNPREWASEREYYAEFRLEAANLHNPKKPLAQKELSHE